MSVRRAEIPDANIIAALAIEVWISTYVKKGVTSYFADYVLSEYNTVSVENTLRDPSERGFVSENEEGLDGYARLTIGRDSGVIGCAKTEISTLYIQPRHQGKGIGKALLSALLSECRDNGFLTPWLIVNCKNENAIRFYTAQGFEKVGTKYFEIDDKAYLNQIMRIDLS